jgi:peptide/nickel transport system substrate-binding protein
LLGTSSTARQTAEFVKRMLDRIGVRATFEFVTTAERVKRMANCRYGLGGMDWVLDVPDGANVMSMFWSKSIGSVNMACYADPAFDAAYEKALITPSGPERTELFRTMQARIDAFAPARPRPMGDTLLLKRGDVRGPFGTFSDWLAVVSLGFEPVAQPLVRR